MATQPLIGPRERRVSDLLIARAVEVATPLVSDNMSRLVAGGAEIRPLHGDAPMAGRALTVQTRPGDNLFVHKAIDIAEPGDVLVVDAGGETTNSIVGEIMMLIARRNGATGFVIDGVVRDIAAFRAAGFPVFARGVNHRGPYKDGPGRINVPVRIGQMVVHPGDLVLGDPDGLLTLRPDEAEDVIGKAEAQLAKETGIMKQIEDGSIDRSWIDEMLRTKGYT
jgi:regulator of RNase E activity RraA